MRTSDRFSPLRFQAKDNGKDKASSIMALAEMERVLHNVCPTIVFSTSGSYDTSEYYE